MTTAVSRQFCICNLSFQLPLPYAVILCSFLVQLAWEEKKIEPLGKHSFSQMERHQLKEMSGKSTTAETHFTLRLIGWNKATLYSKWNPHAAMYRRGAFRVLFVKQHWKQTAHGANLTCDETKKKCCHWRVTDLQYVQVFNCWTRQRWVISHFTPGEITCYPLDRRWGGAQSRSGRCEEEKTYFTPAGNRNPAIQTVTRRYHGSYKYCVVYSFPWRLISLFP
jgi:hypothetical protein